jgi:hypothetical protein
MRFWGSIVGVCFMTCWVTGFAGDYLTAVGPAPLQFAPPPPPLSRLAWCLPLPSSDADVAAGKKTSDVSAVASSVPSKTVQTNAPVAAVMAPVWGTPMPFAFQANAFPGPVVPPPAPPPATANETDATIKSQSPPPLMLLPVAPAAAGGPPPTALALMKYFKPGSTKTGTPDVIVPVPVGFVPPMPMPVPSKPASSSATYLSP